MAGCAALGNPAVGAVGGASENLVTTGMAVHDTTHHCYSTRPAARGFQDGWIVCDHAGPARRSARPGSQRGVDSQDRAVRKRPALTVGRLLLPRLVAIPATGGTFGRCSRCYDGSMTNATVYVVILAGLGLAICTGLMLSLLQLLKRHSMRHAARVPDRGAPPRWSTLHLEEVARIRARPKRLGRSHRGFRPWEESQAPDKRTPTNGN